MNNDNNNMLLSNDSVCFDKEQINFSAPAFLIVLIPTCQRSIIIHTITYDPVCSCKSITSHAPLTNNKTKAVRCTEMQYTTVPNGHFLVFIQKNIFQKPFKVVVLEQQYSNSWLGEM